MHRAGRIAFEQRLVEIAAFNPHFRSWLLQDPRTAVENVLGVRLPKDLNVVVTEESQNTLHFVLPHKGGRTG